ncbi:MAG: hypothetical protein GC134_05875 [Proteobacteria bacterium]|nr:hypothetical protein [Pseudomonadota bacterium]
MAMKRRTLLTGAAAVAAAAALNAPKAWTQDVPLLGGGKGVPLPFKLYTVGEMGDLLRPADYDSMGMAHPDLGKLSVVIELDMMTRKARYMPYLMPIGHWPLVLPDGRIFLTSRFSNQGTFLSPDGEVLKTFKLEEYAALNFGGHSIYDAPRNRIISTVTNADNSGEMTGFVAIVDPKEMKVVGMAPVPGTNNSHELRVLPGGKELVVTGYAKNGNYEGLTDMVKVGWNFADVERAQLSVLDMETLELKRQFTSPNPYTMGHMDVDSEGNVYLEQFRNLVYKTPRITSNDGDDDDDAKDTKETKDDKQSDKKRMTTEKMMELAAQYEHEIGGPRTWPLHQTETAQKGLSTPTAIMKINAYTGDIQELWEKRENHRYVQSVVYHPDLKAVYIASRHSDALVVFPTDGSKPYSRSTADYGIYTACGVCAFPGTPYIGLLSNYSGIAIIDASTMNAVDYYPLTTFRSIHLNPVRMA